jgi:glutamate synthase domain-containing protein 1/glutamate synthase domain-containing protein 3
MEYQEFWQLDSRFGQPVNKDGCGVFGVIRKKESPKISNLTAVSAISCIKYRGSSLGAGYACFDNAGGSDYKIKAFVRDSSVAREIESKLSNFLGPPTNVNLKLPDESCGKKFGIYNAIFPNSAKDSKLEKEVDAINFSLLSDRKLEGRIFSYGKHVEVFKEVGYPLDVASFYGLDCDIKKADVWIAHTRQPTNSPGSSPIWSHPFASLDCAIVHNGDISSFGANIELLNTWGYQSLVGTDSEVIARLLFYLIRVEGLSVTEASTVLTNPFEDDAPRSITKLLSAYRGAKLDGPFAVVAGYCDGKDSYLIALTDRSKFRPLLIGEDENCFYVASEENQIRNISRDAKIWAPEPGSYFIASLNDGLLESGTRKNKPSLNAWNEAEASAKPTLRQIDATGMEFSTINNLIREEIESGSGSIRFTNLSGQRYIGIGASPRKGSSFKIELTGFPGNCLANLNDGAFFEVYGNVADDVADTMHSGSVIVHGDARDVIGQALQGGRVFVRGSVGNRAGIQMREYLDRKPFLLIGECADDYLGEYMAGGMITVLNLSGESNPVGKFVGTGMVGGAIYVRGTVKESQIGLRPKKSDIFGYLKAAMLDGIITEEVFKQIALLEYPDEAALLHSLPTNLFKRLRALFFRSKYTKPMILEHRKLNAAEVDLLAREVKEFFKKFRLGEERLGEVLGSEFTVIKTTEEERETPLPPQEVPVEE